MIKKLKIQNFQSHQESVLNFDPGLNIIVGPSDSGKTAILRSLYWLFHNRPGGEEFRSHWGGDTVVEARIDRKIIRRTKGSKNEYYFNKISHNAFGQDVPEKIKQFLNINEINLQRQLDEPFLLNLSSGKVAEHFNKLANIDIIDEAIKQVQKDIREKEQLIKFKKKNLQETKQTLTEYEHLDSVEAEMQVLEKAVEKRQTLIRKKNAILVILNQIEEIEEQEQEIKTYLTIIPKLETLFGLKETKTAKENKIEMLKTIIAKIAKLDKGILYNRFLANMQGKLIIYGNLTTKKNAITAQINKFKNLLVNYTTVINKLNVANDTLKETVEILNTIPICPFCGTKLKK